MTDPAEVDTPPEPSFVTVELLGLPLDLARRSNEHHLTLTRELALVHAAADRTSTPGKLLTVSAELALKYGRFGDAQRERAVAVAASGGDAVDLRYEVPATAADDAIGLARLYDEVDEFCAAGELVSLVTPPDVRIYRQWLVEQFCSQIRSGAAPARWQGAPAEVPSGAAPTPTPQADTLVIADDLDFQGAAAARGAIAELVEAGVTDLTVDLAGCEFMDSTGISLLLTTLLRLRDSGGSLTIVNASDAVRRTLGHAGVLDLLEGARDDTRTD